MPSAQKASSPMTDVLDNGLRVLCDPVAQVETVALGVWVQAGTLDETNQEHGVAHLLEHMAFKATKSRSARDIAIEVERVGASLDASTSHQRTGFYVRCLREDAPVLCEIVADILINPVFREADLALEQDVVVQEIGEAADEPDDVLFETLATLAWGPVGLGQPILGTPQSVGDQTPDSLRAFMDRTYVAPAMVFSVAGAVTPDQARDLGQSFFTDLKFTNNVTKRPDPVWRGGHQMIKRPTEQSHLAIAFPGVGYDGDQYMAARLFADVLGGGMSSRLFQKVREDRGLAYSVYAFADIFDRGGLIGAYLGTDKQKAPEALDLTLTQIALMADAIDVEELDRVKALARAGLLMARESVASRAEAGAAQMLIFDRLRPVDEILERLMAVTPDQISTIAKGIIESTSPALAVVGPNEGEQLLAIMNNRLSP